MRFRFWEYVFFASTFGAVVFFPAARPLMPLFALPAYALTAALLGLAALTGLTLYEWSVGNRTRSQALAIAAVTGLTAVLLATAGQTSSPEFAVWSLNAGLAVCTFGSILARRIFGRVERDFRRNAVHVLALGLTVNAIGLFAAYLLVLFPPVMIGILVAAVTFVALS